MHLPCRVCGDKHTNTMSRSICPPCGYAESQANAYNAQNIEQEAEDRKEDEFNDIQDIEEMKRWMREYLL
jgi:ribosomal protein L37E